MSYQIQSQMWQRVSILTLLLLIPTVGIAVFRQSMTVAIPANSTTSANSILPNHPNYQALQALANNYSCVVSIPNFGNLPVTRTEFATVLNTCSQRLNELIANNPTTVAQTDLQTLQRLQKEFAPELAILNNSQDTDKLEVRTNIAPIQPTREPLQEQSIPKTKPSGVVLPLPPSSPVMSTVNRPQISKIQAGSSINALVAPETQTGGKFNTENYNRIDDNPFHRVGNEPLSTFSIDVDTAAYSNMRRFITQGQLPPKDAVRIEELINYFPYNYPQPTGNRPFSVTTEVTSAPWNPQHKLVQVGLQGKRLESETLPPSNLVFLIDVSGSMGEPDKLPLVQQSLKLLVNKLRPQDRVSLVVYAGNAGVVLAATPGNQKTKILAAIDRLQAGGSTAGGQGIELAYKIAQQNFLKSGNNRVILATDGDFNVGVSSDAELTRLIEQKRDQGIFLTVLGFGTGNYKDGKMEQLADQGNGNYAYIDTLLEAKKVLVNDIRGTLFTIAKDVKIQVEFNPAKVQAYRLIGYENRLLQNQDFNDDKKDAGEIGAGHSVTALYEIIPTGTNSDVKLPQVDPLRYQRSGVNAIATADNEMMLVKLRYKLPQDSTSQLITQTIKDSDFQINQTPSTNLRFAAAVATFGMILRDSEYKGNANYDLVMKLATQGQGEDTEGYRGEFMRLVEKSRDLMIRK
ncbi:VWA domain-containing protein [Dolichospermum sp. LEGE 00240]|uniref:vWA domain-containing protein n=1 Tax=Dolichospermum sp. LEGE 00240 TaxID=1828603 RepID=UPI001880D67B|nr:VWA domain-containing protein [Dolichospermum sp. LEGE 00240]MDM3844869.1 von Willebrand factor type A domain-containing protein [Aphanizomenon gracile PMC638.10]MDM3850154.1 von Willebrand factor type A domain-containing protein [Aphanizomenon gracile PMC627.10]MDM3855382.1 von Willebrand factor type A domain-containing protein [Aphanizomenon gracile PMC649.10]MDM3862648.1 von Willebrand factor type A domain-containing protein [Aphanizomenon gracile PMC644.10]MBE9247872.1 VWA domain-contai